MGFDDNILDQKIQADEKSKFTEVFERINNGLMTGKKEMIKDAKGVDAISLYKNASEMLSKAGSIKQLNALENDFIKNGLIKAPKQKITQEKGCEIELALNPDGTYRDFANK